MKLFLRFTGVIILGLITFLIAMGLIMVLVFEGLLPALGYPHAVDHLGVFLLVVSAAFLISGILFSLYFTRPLLTMLSAIRSLTGGTFTTHQIFDPLYNDKGRLRLSYRLYGEVIQDLAGLSDSLRAAEQEREMLEKAKSNWISGVSHDLKTPLSYVTGYTAMLLSDDHDWNRDEQQEFLTRIREKAGYIEELIGDMNLSFRLESSDRIPLNLESFDICTYVREIIADTAGSPDLSANELTLEAPDEALQIYGDRKLLRRMLQNLLMNAAEHNPDGTSIDTVIKKADNEIEIIIKDSGAGIPEDMLETLFTRYQPKDNEDSRKTGRGLGLYVTKSIVLAHHGSIDVTSEPGIGTAFQIKLPNRQPDE